jgi:hypothetical protein
VKKLLENQAHLMYCFDNWQRYRKKKEQRGQSSSTFDDGTLSFFREPLPIIAPRVPIPRNEVVKKDYQDPTFPRPNNLVSVGLTADNGHRVSISCPEHIADVETSFVLSLFHRVLSPELTDTDGSSLLRRFLHDVRPALEFAASYQKRAVDGYNPQAAKCTGIRINGLDPFKETSRIGCSQADVKILERGQVLLAVGKDGYVINPSSKVQHKFAFGDVASLVMLKSVERDINELRTHFDDTDFIDAIVESMANCTKAIADLHACFHIAEPISTVHWDSIINPVKTLLKWKRLEKDAKQYFQTFKSIAELIY